MTRLKNKIKYIIASLIILVVSVFSYQPLLLASADEVPKSYDETTIEDDLSEMDLSVYPYNSLGECEVINFMEYCYSRNDDLKDLYGLYIYVYNPTQKPLTEQEGCHKINISNPFVENTSDYDKKELTILDYTDDYRFYKFKLTDSAYFLYLERDYALVNDGVRCYRLVDFQTRYAGDTSEITFNVSLTYTWTGFSSGCGGDSSAESNLECKVTGLETIHLELKSTNYRFGEYEGYSCHDLSSVYFSIPEKYFEKYGELSEVKASWYEYLTDYIFVTSDGGGYKDLLSIRGKKINQFGYYLDDNGNVTTEKTDCSYRVFWEEYLALSIPVDVGQYVEYHWDKGFNSEFLIDIGILKTQLIGSPFFGLGDNFQSINQLDWIFWRNNVNTRDDYKVSSKELKEYMLEYTEDFPSDNLILGRYSPELFDLSNPEKSPGLTVKKFSNKIPLVYVDEDTSQSAWNEFWFGTEYKEYSIKPIEIISKDDLVTLPVYFYNHYKVNSDDYKDIIDFAKKSYENNCRPVLLRFAIRPYYSSTARFDESEDEKKLFHPDHHLSDQDGYVAQESVFLNFDVISLAFENENEVKTVFGVVANPIDIINALTAPSDLKVEENWWGLIIGLLVLILIIIICWPFLSPVLSIVFNVLLDGLKVVIKGVFWAIGIPFRFVGKLFRKRE